LWDVDHYQEGLHAEGVQLVLWAQGTVVPSAHECTHGFGEGMVSVVIVPWLLLLLRFQNPLVGGHPNGRGGMRQMINNPGDCGWSSITEFGCYDRGCVWDPKPGMPWCRPIDKK
jgi:hypothetical protein